MNLLGVLSGGVDSSTAVYWALNEGHQLNTACFFYYGSKHNDQEIKAAQRVCNKKSLKLITVKLDVVAEHFQSDLLKKGGSIPEGHYTDPTMKKTVVPFRNGIMLSIAAGLAESLGLDGILLGNHFGDHAIYPDCRAEFINPMSQAIKAGTYKKIELVSPFVSITKTEIVKIGFGLKVPYELTYSCYKGGDFHCGKCGTCVERIEAFKDAKVIDPTQYEKS
jgi:7-cyano-7-deazaguanine synthase